MGRSLGDRGILIAIIGPSAEVVSGSLLRPINIYYSLKGFKSIRASYIPTRKILDLLSQLRRIQHTDIIIMSGVNPWTSASIAVLGKILRKKVVADFHGFAWLEVNMTDATGFLIKVLLLVSEKISYKLSQYVVAASEWLANVLTYYFGKRKGVIVVENAVSCIFEEVAHKLMESYDLSRLRKYVCGKVLHRDDCLNKLWFIAPLPPVFKSNILAYEELLKLRGLLNENMVVIVTGIKRANVFNVSSSIIPIGYVGYVDYVALLLSSDGVILPYPSNAICGGVRNKVLEAGFFKKTVISTKVGMMHCKTSPLVHYIPISTVLGKKVYCVKRWALAAQKLHEIILQQHTFSSFKQSFITFIRFILMKRRGVP